MRTKHLVPRNDDIDFISSLPDGLCSLIVSFLPAKEAIRTSILAKRWRYVYASSPCLDFDLSLFPRTRGRKQAFFDFVDRTIQIFAGMELCSFRLSMEEYGVHEPRVEDWVGFAVAHNVLELDLGLPKAKLSKIPDCVFMCASLTDLKLRMREYAFELPSPVGLKRLKSIVIKSISLKMGKFIKELFESCLLLEKIVIEDCRIDVLEIEGRRLEKLKICNCDWQSPGLVKISAPRLKIFKYIGAIAADHCLENLTSLDEAIVNLRAPLTNKSDEQCSLWLVTLVQMIGNAKALTLSPWCIKLLSRVQNLPRYLKPQGENLKELVLLLERREDCVQMVAPLLVSCVNVEYFSVSVVPSQSKRRGVLYDKEQLEVKLDIKDTMKHLKIVKLEYIDENKTGLELVKFLLKHARELEKMTIVLSNDGLDSVKYMRQVSLFRKASKNAIIEYSMYAR